MPTPLMELIARRIDLEGPMSVAEYMALCLGHPRHGYYITRDPLGARGDFTTAPEISQMFGELIGLWAAQTWMQLGSPTPFMLVELGPGRGTLMADALRATARVPGFKAATTAHLVETSPALRAKQAAVLARYAPTWHDDLHALPEGPAIIIANEFFDALPIRQFIRGERGWGERKVAHGPDGALVWALDPRPGDALVPPALRQAPPGAVVELCPAGATVAGEIGRRVAAGPGAALIIDYGYGGPAVGDTLQALRGHAPAPVLADPGEADLTAHVDFAALADAAVRAGAVAHGPIDQGAFLTALGIHARAEALKRLATPAQSRDIDAATARLVGDDQMGRLFKAMAVTGPTAPPPAGYESGSGGGSR